MCIRAVYVSGQSHLGLHVSPTEYIMPPSSVNTALQNGESLRFSHLNSVHFTFEERDFCVSVVAQTRTDVPFEVFKVSLYISARKVKRVVM